MPFPVELLQQGARQQAFSSLPKRHDQKIFRLCCSLLRDSATAEDVVQESLLRIWKTLSNFDNRASLPTWIYTITRNRCFTAMQRRRDTDLLHDPRVEQMVEARQGVHTETELDTSTGLLREPVDALAASHIGRQWGVCLVGCRDGVCIGGQPSSLANAWPFSATAGLVRVMATNA